jgi:hypothetical protein
VLSIERQESGGQPYALVTWEKRHALNTGTGADVEPVKDRSFLPSHHRLLRSDGWRTLAARLTD